MKNKMKTKLRKGDMVKVIAGNGKGESGRILSLDLVKGRVLVEGCKIVKKTKKRRAENEQSEIVEIEASIDISNVVYLNEAGTTTRLGYTFADGSKQRIAKKSGEVING